MKKVKTFLASLCASVLLFSATPSFALATHVAIPKEISYEQKAERLANYLQIKGVLQTDYGSFTPTLELTFLKGGFKEDLTIDFPDHFWLVDGGPNGYKGLDAVYRVPKNSFTGKHIDLDSSDEQEFSSLFQELMDKFYYENEGEIIKEERRLREEQKIKNLRTVLENY